MKPLLAATLTLILIALPLSCQYTCNNAPTWTIATPPRAPSDTIEATFCIIGFFLICSLIVTLAGISKDE